MKLDPSGNEYSFKKIEGASKGHWQVVYTKRIQGGYSETSFWERMTDEQMVKSQCFADDYKGRRY